MINSNSDFIFGFEAFMTNPNGDPDQEDKPRMDYETMTAFVSDVRRKRDARNIFKEKGLPIFVDTLADEKVTMETMYTHTIEKYLQDNNKMKQLLEKYTKLKEKWDAFAAHSGKNNYYEIYEDVKAKAANKKQQEAKKALNRFNSEFITAVASEDLIDVRLFGSAMAIDNMPRTFTGPIQINWGLSMHPVEIVKSSTISSIMSDDASTFGKNYKLHYALIIHPGTINKFTAKHTGMTEPDKELFRKALVQGMMANQTNSKQGQTPLFYLEVEYAPNFDGYLGDLRRFINVESDKEAIRSLNDLRINDMALKETIKNMKEKGYINKVIGWHHPYFAKELLSSLEQAEIVDLWKPMFE